MNKIPSTIHEEIRGLLLKDDIRSSVRLLSKELSIDSSSAFEIISDYRSEIFQEIQRHKAMQPKPVVSEVDYYKLYCGLRVYRWVVLVTIQSLLLLPIIMIGKDTRLFFEFLSTNVVFAVLWMGIGLLLWRIINAKAKKYVDEDMVRRQSSVMFRRNLRKSKDAQRAVKWKLRLIYFAIFRLPWILIIGSGVVLLLYTKKG